MHVLDYIIPTKENEAMKHDEKIMVNIIKHLKSTKNMNL